MFLVRGCCPWAQGLYEAHFAVASCRDREETARQVSILFGTVAPAPNTPTGASMSLSVRDFPFILRTSFRSRRTEIHRWRGDQVIPVSASKCTAPETKKRCRRKAGTFLSSLGSRGGGCLFLGNLETVLQAQEKPVVRLRRQITPTFCFPFTSGASFLC